MMLLGVGLKMLQRSSAFLSVGVLILTCLLSTTALAEDVPFGGVGLQVVPTINGELVVLNVLVNAPADEKGLLPGDLIFQVDDFTLQGSDFGKVVSDHLWGPVGSSVELYYRRPGIAGVNRVVVQRSTIDPRLTVTPTVQNGPSASSGSNE
jgi:C-terminal processing protease CtpA/Prc